jgi:hypothetical protein
MVMSRSPDRLALGTATQQCGFSPFFATMETRYPHLRFRCDVNARMNDADVRLGMTIALRLPEFGR